MNTNKIPSVQQLRMRLLKAALIASIAGLALPNAVMAQAQPVCIDPPPIDGTPSVGNAPAGWFVVDSTPDLISGNGPWPGGNGYTASDISGSSTSGGAMGLFLNNRGQSITETWGTTLTGLTPSVTYSVAIEWQQATLAGATVYSGGQLFLSVDGDQTNYTSNGTIANDTWQTVVKTFTATSTTATLHLGVVSNSAPAGFQGPAVVADSGAACKNVNVPTVVASVPVDNPWTLATAGLLLAGLAGATLRRRRTEV